MFLSVHCDVPYVLSLHCMIRWLDSNFMSFSVCQMFLPWNMDLVLLGVEECFNLISLAFFCVSYLHADLCSRTKNALYHVRMQFFVCCLEFFLCGLTSSCMRPSISPKVAGWFGQHFLTWTCTSLCGNSFLCLAPCTSLHETLVEESSHAGNKRCLLQFLDINFWIF